MAIHIAFGAYVPGNSLIHNMKAQVKILLTCAFCVGAFFIDCWLGLILIALALFAGYKVARIPLSKACTGLLPLAFVLAMTVLCHAFVFGQPPQSDSAAAPRLAVPANTQSCTMGSLLINGLFMHNAGSLGVGVFYPLTDALSISIDGIASGLFFALRIALVFVLCALLSFTTSVIKLLEGLEALLNPFRRFGLPVSDICLIASIALRFVPIIAEEAIVVRRAQEARGASFNGEGLLKGIKSWVSVLTPLFVRLFKKGEDLALTLESRCYASASETHRKGSIVLNATDIVILAFGFALCVFIGAVL